MILWWEVILKHNRCFIVVSGRLGTINQIASSFWAVTLFFTGYYFLQKNTKNSINHKIKHIFNDFGAAKFDSDVILKI